MSIGFGVKTPTFSIATLDYLTSILLYIFFNLAINDSTKITTPK